MYTTSIWLCNQLNVRSVQFSRNEVVSPLIRNAEDDLHDRQAGLKGTPSIIQIREVLSQSIAEIEAMEIRDLDGCRWGMLR